MGDRCWESSDPLYNAYHDEEWGRPVLDERGLYERLCLEGFQSGLSWLTILRKREGFRAAFAGFDPEQVARLRGPRRQSDCSPTRKSCGTAARSKPRSRMLVQRSRLRETSAPLPALVWSQHVSSRRAPRSIADWRSTTAESVALAKALRGAGFRFVGPTTVYAAMQACGVVNDHLVTCPSREAAERAIAGARLPVGTEDTKSARSSH